MVNITKRLILMLIAVLTVGISSVAQRPGLPEVEYTLYAYTADGVWSNEDSWTTVIGGQSFSNSLGVPYNHKQDGEQRSFKVVIPANKTIKVDGNYVVNSLEVNGKLIVPKGYNLNVTALSGEGEVQLSDFSTLLINYNTLTSFGGTVILADGVDVPTGFTVGGLEVLDGNSTITGVVTVKNNVKVNGGSLSFVDTDGIDVNDFVVGGNMDVASGASFTTAASKVSNLKISGTLTNNGTIAKKEDGSSSMVELFSGEMDFGWNGTMTVSYSDLAGHAGDYMVVSFTRSSNGSPQFKISDSWSKTFVDENVDGKTSYAFRVTQDVLNDIYGKSNLLQIGISGIIVNKVILTNNPNYASPVDMNLQFVGSTDAYFRNNGTAAVAHVAGKKSSGHRISVVNSGALNVTASTYNVPDYKELPWSVQSGILSLGEGVNIDSWGVPNIVTYNGGGGCDLGSYTTMSNGATLYVPNGAVLEIAGATVNVGSKPGNGERDGAVLVAGTLKVLAGELNMPEYSPGILLINSQKYEGKVSVSNPVLEVDGGVVNTTRVCVYENQPATLNVSDGELNITIKSAPAGGSYNRALAMSKGSQFTMSGGVINISEQSTGYGDQGINGIWLADATVSTYPKIGFSVTGGQINFTGSNLSEFKVFGNDVEFYDVNISGGANVLFNSLNSGVYNTSHLFDNNLRVHNLAVDGASADFTHVRLYISGDVSFKSGSDVKTPCGLVVNNMDEEDRKDVVFCGSENSSYSDESDNGVIWKNVVLQKSRSKLTVRNGALKVLRNLTGDYGTLVGRVDLCDTESGDDPTDSYQLVSTTTHYIKDAVGTCFKEADLHIVETGKNVELASDVYFNSISLDVAKRVNIVNHNLKLNNYPTSSQPWGKNNMFYTENSQGAKGISVPVPREVSNANTVHIGIFDGVDYVYSWTQPLYTTLLANQFVSVTPVFGIHPQLDPASYFPYYWHITSDVKETTQGTYKCYVQNENQKIVGNTKLDPRQPVVLVNDSYHMIGDDIYMVEGLLNWSAKDSYTIIFGKDQCSKNSGHAQFYTNGDFSLSREGLFVHGNKGRTFTAIKNGKWNDKIWTQEGFNVNALKNGSDITADDHAVISTGVNVTIDVPNVKAGRVSIEEKGTLIVEQMSGSNNVVSQTTLGLFDGDGVLQYNISDNNSQLFVNADYSAFCESAKAELKINTSCDLSDVRWSLPYMPSLTLASSDNNTHSFRWNTIPQYGEISSYNLSSSKNRSNVSASSEDYNSSYTPPAKAIDGDGSSRWQSKTNKSEYEDKNLTIDLKELCKINQVVIKWEAANAKEYKILFSTDGNIYNSVGEYNNQTSGSRTDTRNIEAEARYVRIQCTRKNKSSGSYYGYSIFEVEIIGNTKNEVDAYELEKKAYYAKGNDKIINGNLTIDKKITASIYADNAGTLTVKGDVNLPKSSNAKFIITHSGQKARYYFNGNILNYGTIEKGSTPDIFIDNSSKGSGTQTIKNYGTINLDGCPVVLSGDNGVTVSGTTSNAYGKTNLGNMTLSKSAGNKTLTVSVPLGDANGVSSLVIENGSVNHKFANPANRVLTYKGAANFDIPAGCTFTVAKDSHVRLYTQDPANGNCVKLAGKLSISGGELEVSNGDNFDVASPIYGGISYVSGSTIAATGLEVNLSYLAPFSASCDLDFTSQNTNWNFKSGASSGAYGVFDIQNGSQVTMSSGSVNINNVARNSSSNATLYYHPTSSSIADDVVFNLNRTRANDSEFVGIDASKTLGYLVMDAANTTPAMLMNSDLTLSSLTVNGGTFYCNGYDLTLSKDMKIMTLNGFKTGNVGSPNLVNTVNLISAGDEQVIEANAAATDFAFSNLYCRSGLVKAGSDANPLAITVNGNFTLEVGEFNAEKGLICKKDVAMSHGTLVTGSKGLEMSGTSAQKLNCEGEIFKLVIDNASGINADAQQAYPILIDNELQLNNGVLTIGSNVLELAQNATITGGPFGVSKMIRTNASSTDRGVCVNLVGNKPCNMLIPLGDGVKYSPVEFQCLTAATAGKLTVFGNDGIFASFPETVQNYQYLNYYWVMQASAGLRLTSGKVVMTDKISDAKGYKIGNTGYDNDETDKYVTSVLKYDNSLFRNGQDITPEITDDGANTISLIFDMAGESMISGVYSAGKVSILPQSVMAYISVKDGAWSDAIWKEYDVLNKRVKNEAADPISVPVKSGYGIIIDSKVTLDPTKDKGAKLCFLQVNEGDDKWIDFNKTMPFNVGTARGTGKIILRSGDMPGGYFEDFYSVNGGTVEYAGNTDYTLFVNSAYHNNVIISGSGKRYLPNGMNVSVLGNLTLSGTAELVMRGKDVLIGGDMIINGGKRSGDGYYIFNGQNGLQQKIVSNAGKVSLSGLGIDNYTGLLINNDLTVGNLKLTNGVVSMGDNVLSLESPSSEIFVTSKYSYVDGWLQRYCEASTNVNFVLGNEGRNGATEIVAYTSGTWKVRYHNASLSTATIDEMRAALASQNIVMQNPNAEYWEVYSVDNSRSAKVRLRWDDGLFDKSSQVITNDGNKSWIKAGFVTESNASTGTLLVNKYTSRVSGNPRVYVIATTGESTDAMWEGSVDSDWSNPSNWVDGKVPSATSNVKIGKLIDDEFEYPVISNGTSAKISNLDIESDAVLTLAGGKSVLNVTGDINIASGATVNLNYNVNANPNFIANGNVTGDVRVNRTIEADRIYYFGSAVTNLFVKKPTRANDGWSYSNLYMKRYDHQNFEFVNVTTPSPMFDSFGNKTLAETLCTFGIINFTSTASQYRVTPGELLTFWQVGQVSDAKTVYEDIPAYLGSCWYSNPYPFSLKLDKTTFEVSSSIASTLYTRIDNGGWGYKTFNIATGIPTTGFKALAPFQGFELTCHDGNRNAENPRSFMTINPNPYTELNVLQKSASVEDKTTGKILRIFAGTEDNMDEVVFLFNEEGSLKMVAGDSEKKLFDDPDVLNTISTNKGGSALVITHFPEVTELAKNSVNLPISIKKATETKQLAVWIGNLDEFNYSGDIYLVDNLAETRIKLSEVEKYYVPAPGYTFEGRFELSFEGGYDLSDEQGGLATGIEEVKVGEDNIAIWSESTGNARVTIFGELKDDAKVAVYDILGRVVATQPIKNRVSQVAIPENGIFIVKVINGVTSKSEKLVL